MLSSPVARSYRYLHLDVFTGALFGGNQLAVFLDGRGLSQAEMQAIAREMNFSESTFVLPADDAECHCRVRIFTPAAELPMAGHPTVGTAFALARAGAVSPLDATVTLQLGVGPTPVELLWEGHDLRFAWMTQPLPSFATPAVDPDALAAALRVARSSMHGQLPVRVVSCGVPYLIVPFEARSGVDAASLDVEAFDRCLSAAGLAPMGVYLFSLGPGADDDAATYGRMFAPSLGVAEDPATGSASGPLGCYLVAEGVVDPANAATIRNLQGVKMGRPSVIHVSIATTGAVISGVRVGGTAVVAGEGTLFV